MRHALIVGTILLGGLVLAGSAAPASNPIELGAMLGGGIYFTSGQTIYSFGAPGAPIGVGITSTSSVYATFFASRSVMVEPQMGFSLLHAQGSTYTEERFAEQIGFLLSADRTGSPYLAANFAQAFGKDQDASVGIGGGIGYHTVCRGGLAVRFEAQYRRWLSNGGYNEIRAGIGLGGQVRGE